jgi:hypothetical protein
MHCLLLTAVKVLTAVFNAHRASSLLEGELESFYLMMLEEEQRTMPSRGTSMEGPVRLDV